MCVYSMVADDFLKRWPYQPQPAIPMPTFPVEPWREPWKGPSKEDFYKLVKLLEDAKKRDDEAGTPECEHEDKKRLIREMAEKLGVEVILP